MFSHNAKRLSVAAGIGVFAAALSATLVFFSENPTAVKADGEHTHPVCGLEDEVCTDPDHSSHKNQIWTAWEAYTEPETDEDSDEDQNPEPTPNPPPTSGYCYLEDNMVLTEPWIISGELHICLNGHSIICSIENADKYAIQVTERGSLSVCDCGVNGVITSENEEQLLLTIGRNGAVNIYGGSVSRVVSSSGSIITNAGTFNLFGGTIENTRCNNGSLISSSGAVNLYGGEIRSNECTGTGLINSGSVYMKSGVIGSNSALCIDETHNNNGIIVTSVFKMDGGEIKGNICDDGAVIINVKFEMNGGSIKDNRSYINDDTVQAAVNINNCDFIMNGGSIEGNSFDGVRVSGANGTASINKGSEIFENANGISGEGNINVNEAKIYSNGNIGISSTGTVNLNGAEIYDNAEKGLSVATLIVTDSLIYENHGCGADVSGDLIFNSGKIYENGNSANGIGKDGVVVGGKMIFTDGEIYRNNGNGVTVEDLELKSGKIYDNGLAGAYITGTADIKGGQIYKNESGLKIVGGNAAMSGGLIRENEGYGVYVSCGESNFADSKFVMSGGAISGNVVSGVYCESVSDGDGNGGDIYYRSEFIFQDGIISNNSGCGVEVKRYGIFAMTGGEVSHNGLTGIYIDDNVKITSISDGKISYNSGSDGGGIYINASNTEALTLNITNCEISYNGARNGGGLYINGADNLFTLNCGGVNIHHNEASGDGGGIYLTGLVKTVIKEDDDVKSRIAYNSADYGGGIYMVGRYDDEDYADVTVSVSNTEIINNFSEKGGGGIYNERGDLKAADVNFSYNYGQNGGGVYSTGCYESTNVTMQNNTSDIHGGGIYSEGPLNVTNALISGNNSRSNGGGIYQINETAEIKGTEFSTNITSENGGGLYCQNAFLLLENSSFVSNIAQSDGGGVYISTNENSVIDGITISQNKANNGGGIYSEGNGNINMTGCTVSGNTANAEGGGIYSNAGDLNINNGTIESNKAKTNGGGIYNNGSFMSNTSEIKNNTAAADGGGIYARSGCEMYGGKVSGNSAQQGGGIYVDNSEITVNVNAVENNSAANGGGIYLAARSTINMTNMTDKAAVSKNTASIMGGGIYVGLSATLNMNNSAFVSNTAAIGGGVYLDDNSEVKMINSSIKSNTAAQKYGGINYPNSATITIGEGYDYTGSYTFDISGNKAGTANSNLCFIEDSGRISYLKVEPGNINQNSRIYVSLEINDPEWIGEREEAAYFSSIDLADTQTYLISEDQSYTTIDGVKVENYSLVVDGQSVYFQFGHLHKGGEATCTEKAKCDECGQEYGSFGEHDFNSDDGICSVCGKLCEHKYLNGECTVCEHRCEHENVIPDNKTCFSICEDCGSYIDRDSHDYDSETGICKKCGTYCAHKYKEEDNDGICIICHRECPHPKYYDGKCVDCGKEHSPHHFDSTMGKCMYCGYACDHNDDVTYKSYGDEGHYQECGTCGTVISDIEEHEESKEATCTEPAHCDKCGADYGEALGHEWGDEYTDDGSKHYQKCIRCDVRHYSEHSYVDGACEFCGAKESKEPEQTETTTTEPEETPDPPDSSKSEETEETTTSTDKKPAETTTTDNKPETTTDKEPAETTTTDNKPETTTEKEPAETTTTDNKPETTTEKEPAETTTTDNKPEVTTEKEPAETTTTDNKPEVTTEKEPGETTTEKKEPDETTTDDTTVTTPSEVATEPDETSSEETSADSSENTTPPDVTGAETEPEEPEITTATGDSTESEVPEEPVPETSDTTGETVPPTVTDTSGNNGGNVTTSAEPATTTEETTPADTSSSSTTAYDPEIENRVSISVLTGESVANVNLSNSMQYLIEALLSDDEIRLVMDGKDVKIVLNVLDISDSDAIAAIDKLVKESSYSVLQYLDMALLKNVDGIESRVGQAGKEITVVLNIPENLREAGRKYSIVRIDDGVFTTLEDLDNSSGTITFKTDKFSSYYAIVYTSDGGAAADNDGTMYTADGSNITVFVDIGILTVLLMIVLYFTTGEYGITEEKKNRTIGSIIQWGKGRKARMPLAAAGILAVLVYYFTIGQKTVSNAEAK